MNVARFATPLFVKIAGGAIAALLAIIVVLSLLLTASERHGRKLQRNLTAEVAAHAATTARIEQATADAEAADTANVARVRAEQERITSNVESNYRARLAAAHSRADRLRHDRTTSDPSGSAAAPVPGASDTAGGVDEAPGDGISTALICEAQAIQLDELITWVEQQTAVAVNAPVAPADDAPD